MTVEIDVERAKLEIERLIDAALAGELIVLTRDDQPVLRLVRVGTHLDPAAWPAEGRPLRRAGSARGLIRMAEDFDEPLEDFREYTG